MAQDTAMDLPRHLSSGFVLVGAVGDSCQGYAVHLADDVRGSMPGLRIEGAGVVSLELEHPSSEENHLLQGYCEFETAFQYRGEVLDARSSVRFAELPKGGSVPVRGIPSELGLEVEVVTSSFAAQRRSGIQVEACSTQQVHILLDPGATVFGEVVTPDGRALADANISARPIHLGRVVPTRSGHSDREGRFRISGLPRGSISLTAAAPGYEGRIVHVDLTGSVGDWGPERIELGLIPRWTGKVLDEFGRPAVGADVSFLPIGTGPVFTSVTSAGEGGEFEFESQRGGKFHVWAFWESERGDLLSGATEVPTRDPDEELLLVVAPPDARLGVRIEGMLRDSESEPPWVEAQMVRDPRGSGLEPVLASWQEGVAWLEALHSGTWEIRVSAPGFSSVEERVFVGPGDSELVIRLRETPQLSGRVERLGGGPVSGAKIVLWREHWVNSSLRHPERFVSDESGKFEVSGIEPGRYRMVAKKGQLAGMAECVVSRGHEATQVILVEPCATVVCQLESSDASQRSRVKVALTPVAFGFSGTKIGLTNKSGRVRFEGLPAGRYSVSVDHSGILDERIVGPQEGVLGIGSHRFTRELEVRAGETELIEFGLDAPSGLPVEVVAVGDCYLRGAHVQIQTSGAGEVLDSLPLQSNQTVTLFVPGPGEYWCTLMGNGLSHAIDSRHVSVGENGGEVVLGFVGGSIRGRFEADDGAPLGRGAVTIAEVSVPEAPSRSRIRRRSGLSAEDGFHFEGLPAGEYQVFFEGGESRGAGMEVPTHWSSPILEVEEGADLDLGTIELGYSLEHWVRVRSAGGVPCPGARVLVGEQTHDSGVNPKRLYADETGLVCIGAFADISRVWVLAQRDGESTAWRALEEMTLATEGASSSNSPLDLVLEEIVPIRIRTQGGSEHPRSIEVLDPGGRPMPIGSAEWSRLWIPAVVGDEGEIVGAGIVPGSYRVQFRDPRGTHEIPWVAHPAGDPQVPIVTPIR